MLAISRLAPFFLMWLRKCQALFLESSLKMAVSVLEVQTQLGFQMGSAEGWCAFYFHLCIYEGDNPFSSTVFCNPFFVLHLGVVIARDLFKKYDPVGSAVVAMWRSTSRYTRLPFSDYQFCSLDLGIYCVLE